ncbi:MAG: hypothetical protein GXY03_02600 [Solirubrobacterales bacterium]|nr:hypothetical protein [Solirubrobacterales bacterium]
MSAEVRQATIVAQYARRIPDPTLRDVERHVMFVRALDMPAGLPKDPNPREQKTNRIVYREVGKHLLNEEGTSNTFHLKNKGITLIADSVRRSSEDEQAYEVSFSEGQGIVDGGHTYEILLQSRQAIEDRSDVDETDAIEQFVKVEIITGLPRDLVPEIAGGLNTAVQVQAMSLADLRDEFEWIKDELADEPYAERISFRENEDRLYDARDIVVLLDLFNIWEFPNHGREYPLRAFSSKAAVLKAYLDDQRHNGGDTYRKLQPILREILELRDTISFEARELHNKGGGSAGKLAYVEGRSRGTFCFPFIGEEGQYRLRLGALFPMLGSFRWMVEEGSDGNAQWVGGFGNVLALWRELGVELMKATQGTSEELGRNPNAIGKSRNHWANLHSTIAKHQLIGAR